MQIRSRAQYSLCFGTTEINVLAQFLISGLRDNNRRFAGLESSQNYTVHYSAQSKYIESIGKIEAPGSNKNIASSYCLVAVTVNVPPSWISSVLMVRVFPSADTVM